jgi:hypothetical protein
VLDAREMRQGDKGNIFVSTLFVGNKVYVLPEKAKDGKREPKVIIDKTEQATGIEFNKGTLFFATNKKIVRYDNIEDKLDNPGEPKVLTDKLPGGSDHSWKFLRVHKDKLYYNDRRPCNICDPGEYAKIYRMNLDGSNVETIASGVRNTVGFDFDRRPAISGSPTTVATGSARSCRTTSSTTSRSPAGSTSAIRTVTRAASPTRSSAGASRATTTSSRPRCSGRMPARWG